MSRITQFIYGHLKIDKSAISLRRIFLTMSLYSPILLFIISLFAWIRVSVILFRIYDIGVEVSFNVRYKSMQNKKTSELRKEFSVYLTFLWTVKVLSSFFIVVFLALHIITPN